MWQIIYLSIYLQKHISCNWCKHGNICHKRVHRKVSMRLHAHQFGCTNESHSPRSRFPTKDSHRATARFMPHRSSLCGVWHWSRDLERREDCGKETDRSECERNKQWRRKGEREKEREWEQLIKPEWVRDAVNALRQQQSGTEKDTDAWIAPLIVLHASVLINSTRKNRSGRRRRFVLQTEIIYHVLIHWLSGSRLTSV